MVFKKNLNNFTCAFVGQNEILSYCRLALLEKQAKNYRYNCNGYEF